MQVALKVIGGKNNGREIKISIPKFIIGRGEQAHLRPSSDLISRQHCAISIENGQVTVEDLGSRNGTFVNETQLEGPHVAKLGDVVKVGRLQFEIMIDHAQSGAKKPRVNSVAEVAKRTVAAEGGVDEDSITDWLSEPDEMEKVTETKQFRLDETTQLFGDRADSTTLMMDQGAIDTEQVSASTDEQDSSIESESESESDSDSSSGLFGRKKKKEKGKLPPKPKFSSESSTTAADDVLKKFFNRR